MNEILFIVQVLTVFAFGMLALRFGKSALITWISLQAVLANLFVLKQMTFFGFHITCSDVFAIGSILGLNLLREYFGKQAADKGLWACFFSMLFFVAMAQLHLLYQPSPYDTAQGAYQTLLSPSPRLLLASLAVFFIVQQIDLRLFSYLKEKLTKLPLTGRNAVSLTLSQFLDTVLFSYLGLYGLVSSLWDIIAISFLVKLIIISCSSPLIAFSKRIVPLQEEVR
ncbi:MAG: queuosine precursor transporter [Parachlamydiales bacterium]